jgi:hypothetical protein
MEDSENYVEASNETTGALSSTPVIAAHMLPDGEYTDEGPYYVTVNGDNVGEPDRAFWPTRKLAMMCGRRFVIAMKMQEIMRLRESGLGWRK